MVKLWRMDHKSSITAKLHIGWFVIAAMVVVGFQAQTGAQIVTDLGNASGFAVLGGSTVTNTGNSTIVGDVGVSPGTAITGFPPGISGTRHFGDALAALAHADVVTLYNHLMGLTSTVDLTGQDLGGLTLTPGVYKFSSTAQLTGLLTLDALGDSAAKFIFQIGSTLTTASGSNIIMINSGEEAGVYWQVGSSATLGTNTAFKGNILAQASITLTTAASILNGRALAIDGAVTLDTNDITIPNAIPLAVPEPGSVAFALAACVPVWGFVIRRRKQCRAVGPKLLA